MRPQVLPGSVQADGRGVRDGERVGRVPVLPGQRHQPSGAGQHLRRAVEGRQQEQRRGQLRLQPGRRDQEGERSPSGREPDPTSPSPGAERAGLEERVERKSILFASIDG